MNNARLRALDDAVLARLPTLVPGFTEVSNVDHRRWTTIISCATAGPDVIVKVDRGRGGAPADTYARLAEIGQILADVERIEAPRAIAWNADPRMLVMSHVAGRGVEKIIARAVSTKRDEDLVQAIDAVTLAGEALARLHRGLPTGRDDPRDVVKLASRFYRVREPSRDRTMMVRNVSDFSTSNLRYNSQEDRPGTLYLLDPSPSRRRVPAENDLGYFLMTLMNSTVGCSSVIRRRYALRMYRKLSANFIDSYCCASRLQVGEVLRPEGIGLFAGYRAALWGSRRLRDAPGLRVVALNALWWSLLTRVGRRSSPWLERGFQPVAPTVAATDVLPIDRTHRTTSATTP